MQNLSYRGSQGEMIVMGGTIISGQDMEALRIQIGNLRWEVNRLEIENRMVKAKDWEASNHVD